MQISDTLKLEASAHAITLLTTALIDDLDAGNGNAKAILNQAIDTIRELEPTLSDEDLRDCLDKVSGRASASLPAAAVKFMHYILEQEAQKNG